MFLSHQIIQIIFIKSPDLLLVHFSDFCCDVSRIDEVRSQGFSPETNVAITVVVVAADAVATVIDVVVADDVVVGCGAEAVTSD